MRTVIKSKLTVNLLGNPLAPRSFILKLISFPTNSSGASTKMSSSSVYSFLPVLSHGKISNYKYNKIFAKNVTFFISVVYHNPNFCSNDTSSVQSLVKTSSVFALHKTQGVPGDFMHQVNILSKGLYVHHQIVSKCNDCSIKHFKFTTVQ